MRKILFGSLFVFCLANSAFSLNPSGKFNISNLLIPHPNFHILGNRDTIPATLEFGNGVELLIPIVSLTDFIPITLSAQIHLDLLQIYLGGGIHAFYMGERLPIFASMRIEAISLNLFELFIAAYTTGRVGYSFDLESHGNGGMIWTAGGGLEFLYKDFGISLEISYSEIIRVDIARAGEYHRGILIIPSFTKSFSLDDF